MNDLLIKISVQQEDVCRRLGGIEAELKKRQCMLHTSQISTIEKNFNVKLCSQNTEKIKTVEKITWSALVATIGLILKSFYDTFIK